MCSSQQRTSSGLSWWPNLVGGLVWPFVTILLSRWIPLHFAAALTFALIFGGLGFIYVKSPPSPDWTLSKWLGGAVLGAVMCGVITYFLPWA